EFVKNDPSAQSAVAEAARNAAAAGPTGNTTVSQTGTTANTTTTNASGPPIEMSGGSVSTDSNGDRVITYPDHRVTVTDKNTGNVTTYDPNGKLVGTVDKNGNNVNPSTGASPAPSGAPPAGETGNTTKTSSAGSDPTGETTASADSQGSSL